MKLNTLYNKYVDVKNLKNIGDFSVQIRFLIYSIMIPLFLAISVGIVTFFGYNFRYVASIVGFLLAALSLLVVVNCAVRFILRDRQYHVFLKHNQLKLLLGIYFLIALPFYIFPIFTVQYSSTDSISVSGLIASIILFFLIYLPIMIGYVVFSYLAYIKCFAKYLNFEDEETNRIKYNTNTSKPRPFYKRFINEKNLRNVDNINNQQRFYRYSRAIPVWLFLSAFVIAFSGFRFENWWKCTLFAVAILILLEALYCAVRLILLDTKYRVFKRRWYPFLFLSVYFILISAFYVFVYFKVTITTSNGDAFDPTQLFLWLIFLPLLIQYHSFCYSAYNECFNDYFEKGEARRLIRKRRKKEDNAVIDMTDFEDDD